MRARLISLALAVVLAPLAAQAQEVKNFPLERLHLSLDRFGIIDVESADVIPHLSWDAGLVLGVADDPFVMRDGTNVIGRIVDTRIGASLFGTVGLAGLAQIGLEVPVILYQDGDEHVPGLASNSYSSAGLGDVRLAARARLLRSPDKTMAVGLGLSLTFPSGGSDNYFGEDSLTVTPALLVSKVAGKVRVAANLGYLIRKNTGFLDQQVEDELVYHVGAALKASEPLEIGVALSGALAAADPLGNSNQAPMELLGQLAYSANKSVVLFAGGGLGVVDGFGTPDFRGFLGARFGMLSFDEDGDGIEDAGDKCPKQAEDKDSFEDADGCLDADNDTDEILDSVDRAPNDAEDKDGFEDEDGAPDLDNDKDGIEDKKDKCANEPENVNEYEDEDGCPDVIPDTDGDGLNDKQDGCPTDAEDKDGFQDEDGCPDPDNDGDGIIDSADACIDKAGPVENRGCPDTDRDGDTVVDRLDNCPDEAGAVDNQGCKKKQLVVITSTRFEILDVVNFKTNKDEIVKTSFGLLDNVAAVIIAHPEVGTIRVEGHTDNKGKPEKNLDLSKRRAASVVKYLVKKGVPADRLVSEGYGDTQPIAENKDEKGRAKNRRVEFKIVNAQK